MPKAEDQVQNVSYLACHMEQWLKLRSKEGKSGVSKDTEKLPVRREGCLARLEVSQGGRWAIENIKYEI